MKAKPKAKQADEQRFIRLLKQEAAAASSYHDSELAKAQEDALKRYFAEPYGNEVKGRCSVVTHDIEDTVNWIMPDLIRAFTSAENLISLKARKKDDDEPFQMGQDPQTGAPIMSKRSKADIIAAYLSHIYFEDNPGLEITHDVAFDGLVQRVGIWRIAWEDPETEPSEIIDGVSALQAQRYLDDPEYEILAAEQTGEETFIIEVQRTPRMGRVDIEATPPEEFAIEKTAKSVDAAKYHRRKRKVYLSEIIRKYPEHKEALEGLNNKLEETYDDGREQARHPRDSIDDWGRDDDHGRREVELHEEFIRYDFDGDGVVELRHVKRIGDVLLENIRVKNSEYVTWTPSRVSHKAIGRSLVDMLKDLSQIRTEITRRYLDSLAQTVTPRTYVNIKAFAQNEAGGHDGIDALLENEVGAIIPLDGPPQEAVFEAVTPDVSAPCLTALEYFDQAGQVASGVSKHSQGMDPQALNKTATGIDLLQAAAKTRVEMVARWLGNGLEQVLKRCLELIVAHQDKPRQIKLFGEWVEVDPREWSDEMAVSFNVGAAGVSKQARLQHMQMIAESQLGIIDRFGPQNPIVTLQHFRASLAGMAGLMGFKDASVFYGEVPEDWAPPEQQDPKAMEVQAKMQLEQAKAEQTLQLEAAKAQNAAQVEQQKMASDREKAAMELQLAREKAAAEMQLARERMLMEMQLARERATMEMQLAERDSQRKHQANMKAAEAKASMNGSGGSGISRGYRPGGSLSE